VARSEGPTVHLAPRVHGLFAGRAQTIAGRQQPLQRVPGLYPRYMRNDQKDRLSAMELAVQLAEQGMACAAACFWVEGASDVACSLIHAEPAWIGVCHRLSAASGIALPFHV